jgi:hypothetical protein
MWKYVTFEARVKTLYFIWIVYGEHVNYHETDTSMTQCSAVLS